MLLSLRAKAILLLVLAPTSAISQERIETTGGRVLILHSGGRYEDVYPDKNPSKTGIYIDYIDLRIDIDKMIGEKIKIKTNLNAISGGEVLEIHPPGSFSHNAILGWDGGLSRADRRFMLTNCEGGCDVSVIGTVESKYGMVGLSVNELIR